MCSVAGNTDTETGNTDTETGNANTAAQSGSNHSRMKGTSDVHYFSFLSVGEESRGRSPEQARAAQSSSLLLRVREEIERVIPARTRPKPL